MERLGFPKTDEELAERLAGLRKFAADVAALGPLRPSNKPDGVEGCTACDGAGWCQDGPGDRYRRCACVLGAIDVYTEGVPYEFHGATLANFVEQAGNAAALAKGKGFMSGTRDLFLTGGVGAGKTRLACSLLNESARARKGGYFARVPMALYQLQPGRRPEDVAELEHQLFMSPLLVMDDLGAERDAATDYTRRTLLMIYEQRGDRGLRTIWTSNKTLDELAAMHDDDRLTSRIAGRSDAVKLTAEDQRQRKYAADRQGAKK